MALMGRGLAIKDRRPSRLAFVRPRCGQSPLVELGPYSSQAVLARLSCAALQRPGCCRWGVSRLTGGDKERSTIRPLSGAGSPIMTPEVLPSGPRKPVRLAVRSRPLPPSPSHVPRLGILSLPPESAAGPLALYTHLRPRRLGLTGAQRAPDTQAGCLSWSAKRTTPCPTHGRVGSPACCSLPSPSAPMQGDEDAPSTAAERPPASSRCRAIAGSTSCVGILVRRQSTMSIRCRYILILSRSVELEGGASPPGRAAVGVHGGGVRVCGEQGSWDAQPVLLTQPPTREW